jgi:hypothetical protein
MLGNVHLIGHPELTAVLRENHVIIPSGTRIVWNRKSPPARLHPASIRFIKEFEEQGIFSQDRFLQDKQMSPSGAAALLLGRRASPKDWIPIGPPVARALPSVSPATEPKGNPISVVHQKSNTENGEGHFTLPNGSKGWSYNRLFSKHCAGAKEITIKDPFIRKFHQIRNLMEFLVMIYEVTLNDGAVNVHLVTGEDGDVDKQIGYLSAVQSAFIGSHVTFYWKISKYKEFHDRSISIDSTWKIIVGRGLDIFDLYKGGDFSLEKSLQSARTVKDTDITVIRVK